MLSWVKFKKMLVFSMKSPNSACTGSAPYPQQHCSKLNANYYEWVTPWLVMYSLKSKVIGLEFTHSLQVTHTLKIHTHMLLCRGESTASILLIQGAGTFEFLKLLFSFALAYCTVDYDLEATVLLNAHSSVISFTKPCLIN